MFIYNIDYILIKKKNIVKNIVFVMSDYSCKIWRELFFVCVEFWVV